MTDVTQGILPPGAADRDRRRMPAGARLIVGFEFFERFSFYALLSLLALFLTASRASGGMALGEAEALSIVGIFTGLMYAAPLLGGWLADRVIGHRWALLGGSVAMVLGYCLLTLAALRVDGDVAATLVWISLAVLVIGNALMKSTAVIVFGDAFKDAAPARDRAYAYYYMGINLGGVAAGLAAGTLVAAAGWPEGFAACALAMALACGLFALRHRQLLTFQPAGGRADPEGRAGRGTVLGRVGAIGVYAVALCALSIGVFQLFGAIALLLENGMNRQIGGWAIPTQWFISLYSLVLIAAPPVLAAWRPSTVPSAPHRYAAALAFGAVALSLLAAAARLGQGSSFGLLVGGGAIALLAIGEVTAWTISYSLVYRLAPAGTGSLVMGAFYAATLGFGGYLAGSVGGFVARLGYEHYFLGLAVLLGIFALVMRVIAGPLNRWTQRLYEQD